MTTALIIDVIVTDRYRDWVYKLCLWKSYVHIEEINLEYMIFNFPHDGEAEDDDELLTDGNGAKIESEPDMNAMIGESIYIPSSVEIPFLQNLYR